jgi:proline dehydrogenase
MEGSAYTESTLRLFRQVDASRDVLGVAIQTYLYRSEQDVQDLLKFGARIRLVKGAYQEPPEIAFARKADVDRNFIRLTEMLLSNGGYHAIATHDPRMIAATQAFGRALGLGSDRYEFQMLYGIRRDLQQMLLRDGYRVRVYVPYGRQWYAYFMRRLAERPANVFFLLRAFLRK